MAKHDQRILKFLNQNSDRAPTITEMMTRLNISISDISDSLGSLQGQGLISKKTNGQGIECWFPTASHAAQPIPAAVLQGGTGRQPSSQFLPQAQPMATQQMPVMGSPIAADPHQSGVRSGLDSRFLGGMPAPEPQPPMPKAVAPQVQPVPVQHMAEPPYGGRESSVRNAFPEIPSQPEAPAFNPNAFGLAPAKSGVGILTLAVGLVAAVALSTFLAGRMVSKEMGKLSTGFVDRKALEAAKAELAAFDEKTKTHVQSLEADLKKLTAELAASKAAADSMKVAAAKAEPAKAEPKGKAAKKPAVAKSKSGSSALAKAAARGAAMRKKARLAAAAQEDSDYGSESSRSESSRGVPEPPGLEDLPPPPSE